MEVIVLSSLPYQESGRILSLFAKTTGQISAIIKRIEKKHALLTNVLSPLSYSQVELTKGQSDLYQIQEASLLNAFLPIRSNFDALLSAGKVLKTLKKSQLPERPAPILFSLTLSYLKRLETSSNPLALSLSFKGKILRYEGLFPEHLEDSPIPFQKEEWEALTPLSFSKSFEEIENLKPPPSLESQLDSLFSFSFELL